DRQRLPLGDHLDLGARAYVGFSRGGDLLAVAAQNDRRLRSSSGAAGTGARRAGRGRGEACGGPAAAKGAAEAEVDGTAAAADVHAPVVARAYGGVPARLEPAAFVDRDRVPLVVDQNERSGNTRDRAVLVVE